MSNSSLVDYIKISPNKTSPRKHKIDTITIHCVVGQCSVETLGNIFFPTSRQASSNYGIGFDGRIGMYVEEKDRSWCSGGEYRVNGISGSDNDHRAITIEVASDTTHPYAVNDKAYASLIELLVDICRRNDIKELKWKGDKNLVGQIDKQNMTVHRWFANKSCPGDYLYNLHKAIANEVNIRLGNLSSEEQKANTSHSAKPQSIYKVYCGFFNSKSGATRLLNQLKSQGFSCFVVQVGKYWRIQLGAFSNKENAEALLKKLQDSGHNDALISHIDESIKKDTTDEIKVGDKVKVLKAETYTGSPFKLYYTKYDVFEVKGDRVVIGIGTTVVAPVHKDNLKRIP